MLLVTHGNCMSQVPANVSGGASPGHRGEMGPSLPRDGGTSEERRPHFSAEVGDVRPEVGDVRPEVGDVRSEVGDVRPEVGDVRSEVGDVRPEVGDIRPEVGDIRPEVGDIRPEVGDIRPEVGDIRSEVGDIRPEVGDVRRAGALTNGSLLSRPAETTPPGATTTTTLPRSAAAGRDKEAVGQTATGEEEPARRPRGTSQPARPLLTKVSIGVTVHRSGSDPGH